jgi:hypothetical protein
MRVLLWNSCDVSYHACVSIYCSNFFLSLFTFSFSVRRRHLPLLSLLLNPRSQIRNVIHPSIQFRVTIFRNLKMRTLNQSNINQTPGNHPKVDILNTEHGESLKSSTNFKVIKIGVKLWIGSI